jgi:hypothetical protein
MTIVVSRQVVIQIDWMGLTAGQGVVGQAFWG